MSVLNIFKHWYKVVVLNHRITVAMWHILLDDINLVVGICSAYTSYTIITDSDDQIDRSHPNGSSQVYLAKCNATFDVYIPIKWNRFPFILIVTRQQHCHFPPPPEKLPKQIADEVVETIKHQDILDLTARKYMLQME